MTRLHPRWAPRRRDHRKILVVDGEVAFTGGLNIGDEYLRGASFQGRTRSPWRDSHVRVTGPAVRLRDLLIGALERSRRHVRPVTPYFVPGIRLREALAATASTSTSAR